jgi:hypothetical protein
MLINRQSHDSLNNCVSDANYKIFLAFSRLGANKASQWMFFDAGMARVDFNQL